MAARCERCGAAFGVVDRMRGRVHCAKCETELAASRSAYESRLGSLADPSVDPEEVAAVLQGLESKAEMTLDEAHDSRLKAVVHAVDAELADDLWTDTKDARIARIAMAVGVRAPDLTAALAGYSDRFALGRVNAGELRPIASPVGLMLRPSESVFLQTDARLLKEIVDREMRGGYRGVSVRVAKGVRLNTGGVRARSVVVGSHMEAQDEGVLSVTSQRIVFAGDRKALEFHYDKLLGLRSFTDAVGLQIANRASEPLFAVDNGALVSAVITAASSAR